MSMVSNRLEQQMALYVEIDKLKRVDRQTLIVDGIALRTVPSIPGILL